MLPLRCPSRLPSPFPPVQVLIRRRWPGAVPFRLRGVDRHPLRPVRFRFRVPGADRLAANMLPAGTVGARSHTDDRQLGHRGASTAQTDAVVGDERELPREMLQRLPKPALPGGGKRDGWGRA